MVDGRILVNRIALRGASLAQRGENLLAFWHTRMAEPLPMKRASVNAGKRCDVFSRGFCGTSAFLRRQRFRA